MFIETIPNRTSPPAILLRESYREGRRVRKRTLANLSKLPPHVIEGLQGLLKGGAVVAPGSDGLEIVRALPHGHVAVALGVIETLDLRRLLLSKARDAQSRRYRDIVLALIVDRLIGPRSKLAFARSLAGEAASSSIGEVLGLGDVAEREVYAALDWLLAQQARVEAALARRHLQDGTLVLYDVSSSYLEGSKCALARFGYSRDRRADRPQIVYGLLCDRRGRPIAIEVFAGDTADPATLASQIAKLEARFRLARVVMVGDRGMLTSARIGDALEPAGLDWITSLRAPAIHALAADDGPLQLSLFDARDMAEITSPDYPGERLIVCRNPRLAEERARKRQDLIAATEAALTRIKARVERKGSKLRAAAAIGLRVGAVVDKRKMAKHIVLEIEDGALGFRRNEASIRAEARLDGLYVVRTSVPAGQMGAADAVQAYKDLAHVERAFRSLKTSELEIRPIRHWLDARVRAHVFLCMLAYHVEWHLRTALADLVYDDPDPAAGRQRRSSPVQPARRSAVAETKRKAGRGATGLPILGLAELMRHLGTLTRNTMRTPLQGNHTFILCSRPTPLQQAAFARLGLHPMRVQ